MAETWLNRHKRELVKEETNDTLKQEKLESDWIVLLPPV